MKSFAALYGYREPVVRWLREHGLQAQSAASRWEDESDEADVMTAAGSAPKADA